jgi:hypothetical protein
MRKTDVKWTQFRSLLLSITDENGVIKKPAREIAEQLKIPQYSRLTYILKINDKVFNGRSQPHINKVSKEIYEKYINTDFLIVRSNSKKSEISVIEEKQVSQQKIEFDSTDYDIKHELTNIMKLLQDIPDIELSKNGYLKIAQSLHKVIKNLK